MASIKDLKRMCASCDCASCPLNEGGAECFAPDTFSDDADELVDKWVQENPVKTYAMDFFEKFPNAKKAESGEPYVCRDYIYQSITRPCNDGYKNGECKKCWNEEMKEDV